MPRTQTDRKPRPCGRQPPTAVIWRFVSRPLDLTAVWLHTAAALAWLRQTLVSRETVRSCRSRLRSHAPLTPILGVVEHDRLVGRPCSPVDDLGVPSADDLAQLTAEPRWCRSRTRTAATAWSARRRWRWRSPRPPPGAGLSGQEAAAHVGRPRCARDRRSRRLDGGGVPVRLRGHRCPPGGSPDPQHSAGSQPVFAGRSGIRRCPEVPTDLATCLQERGLGHSFHVKQRDACTDREQRQHGQSPALCGPAAVAHRFRATAGRRRGRAFTGREGASGRDDGPRARARESVHRPAEKVR